ncbi:MAG: VOC family protein [Bacteroidota bacterium]
MRFAHTNIISKDWRKLVTFYTQTFDCKLVPPIRKQSGSWLEKGTGMKNAALEGAHLRLPGYGEQGPTLEIYQYESVTTQEMPFPNHQGFGHIAFEVENVLEIVESLKQNGGTLAGEITQKQVEGVGEITFVYARDPEGNLIELQQWKYD